MSQDRDTSSKTATYGNDAIAKSKRILALVDAYVDTMQLPIVTRKAGEARTSLLMALINEFEAVAAPAVPEGVDADRFACLLHHYTIARSRVGEDDASRELATLALNELTAYVNDLLAQQREAGRRDMHDADVSAVMAEVSNARANWPPFNSAHEGFAVLLEEVDELKAHVWTNQKRRDLLAMRKEAMQVAAMALRFMGECCDETTGRK